MLKINLDEYLNYYINIINEDIFEIFKKSDDNCTVLLSLPAFESNNYTFDLNNNAKKKRKVKKFQKIKKTKLKQLDSLPNIVSHISISGSFCYNK